ncbi:WhiB family transcription factor [Microbacterium phage Pumpernickel]|uniref:WhiB family transcription factor n=1 Tax=Microbacterium phage Pumpernickel TaxID=2885983 RepID=A0AAE9C3F0_9CAUD|nr:WhiB family transcription factor [Microbacterium phage Pumpernickel]UDL15896.1 WhiB family transcription factor [Microbacterium phage Pumpernickel]
MESELDPYWRDEAECAKPENRGKWLPVFFSTDGQRIKEAKSICATCPVRRECLTDALSTQEIWGTRAGLDQEQMRRTLSVDADGKEIRRKQYPRCPFCNASTDKLKTKTVDLPEGGRWSVAKAVECSECGFEWKSRTSYNAVTAFAVDRKRKQEAARKAEIARNKLETR